MLRGYRGDVGAIRGFFKGLGLGGCGGYIGFKVNLEERMETNNETGIRLRV